MLTEEARVIGVEPDGLWVETRKKSTCAQCSAKYGCGQKLLADYASTDMTCIKAFFADRTPNRLWLNGETVEIGIEEHALLLGTLVSYLVPLLSMLACCVVAAQFSSADWIVALSAMLGLALGALFARWHSARNQGNDLYNAVVLGIPKH